MSHEQGTCQLCGTPIYRASPAAKWWHNGTTETVNQASRDHNVPVIHEATPYSGEP